MINVKKKSKCSGCYACQNICPQQCIQMKVDNEGFWYPYINRKNCIDCELCIKACPIISTLKIEETNGISFAAYNRNQSIRFKSSSGGIFTAIAEYIISLGGIVYGASFDDDFDVCHIGVDTNQELEKLRGSKYVQSKIGLTYKEAEMWLKKERLVLFTGTPCQIAGLKAYLRKDYPNLICQDLLCHGVPSPSVWHKYVEIRSKTIDSDIQGITFRRKDEGWKLYSVAFSSEKDTEYRNNLTKDPFMRGFLANIYLRPSCYDCYFKTLNRDADITLADFWGVEKILPEMDDDQGTSLVLINSDKGEKIFDAITSSMKITSVNLKEAVSSNPSAIYSCLLTDKRRVFYQQFSKHPDDLIEIIGDLTKVPFINKIKGKIKQITGGLFKKYI